MHLYVKLLHPKEHRNHVQSILEYKTYSAFRHQELRHSISQKLQSLFATLQQHHKPYTAKLEQVFTVGAESESASRAKHLLKI